MSALRAVPWYAETDWEPPGTRQIGNDYRMEHDLRAWTFGKPLTPGLPHIYETGVEESGHFIISYADGRKHGSDHGTWSVSARQTITSRDLAVYGYGSLTSALEDCLAMARDYERDDLLELAMPGLS